MNIEELLANCPLISIQEAADIQQVNKTTSGRQLDTIRNHGRATYHEVGRGGRRQKLWAPTRHGALSRYVYPERVPWWNTEGGLRSVLRRVEWHRATYQYAHKLFRNAEEDWFEGDSIPALESCVFIRGPRAGRGQREPGLIQAVLTYEGGYTTFVCWVGVQHTVYDLRRRWAARFDGLDTFSADELPGAWGSDMDQPDPEYDPTPRPSVYLILCDDELALLTAAQNLPRDGYRGGRQPVCFVNLKTGQSHYEGQVRPRPHDRVEDSMVFPPRRLGDPLRVIRPDEGAHPEDIFGSVERSRILNWAAEWSGLRVRDLARLLKRARKDIRPIVKEMVKSNWLQEINKMLYLGRNGILFVARRDRVSPDTVRARVGHNISMDHRRVGAHRLHTIAVNETMIRLVEAGIPVFAGWRALWNLGQTQLAPDLVIIAESRFGIGVHNIEIERTAVRPEQVASKIVPWETANEMRRVARVIFVTERPEPEELFKLQGAGLPLLTSTLGDIRRGPLTGDETAWRLDGNPTFLRIAAGHTSRLDADFGVLTWGEA